MAGSGSEISRAVPNQRNWKDQISRVYRVSGHKDDRPPDAKRLCEDSRASMYRIVVDFTSLAFRARRMPRCKRRRSALLRTILPDRIGSRRTSNF